MTPVRARYIEELKLQLMFVDDVRDYEEIMETISFLEQGWEDDCNGEQILHDEVA